ncbi:methionine--tRNA ligase, mitochondrial-like [Patiria miniata]|uniref:Methionine--tRNA ligase, mitochondrial n=1 Tax=Patiria miniata TaxID=46514 RepID=A0A913ZDU0_PATMI|nr:methionine--tRNA ligase, mitochondrial-like [Patiria miniata]
MGVRCFLGQFYKAHVANLGISRVQVRAIGSAGSSGNAFLTTPIFYVNAVPHIGHLYSALIADCAHRWQQNTGAKETIFATGTDEHGLKVQQAASSAKMKPQEYCDRVSREFRRLFTESNVKCTDFIRTTEVRHQEAVNHFWTILQERGHIYKGKYEGWYSTSDETFLSTQQVRDSNAQNGVKVCTETGNPVEWTTETNYMFRLSEFPPRLLEWLDNNPRAVYPAKFHTMVRQWLEDGLQDLSVSRQRDRLQWGIPVPGDSSQTIYVWLDALVNYLTVCGFPGQTNLWPATHIVGKDILKFHAIYWPAFLLAAGLPPPRSIVCHSHWTMDNFKMSKSRGNVVDPFDRLRTYTPDGLRYFLLREGVLHSDGDYTDEKVLKLLNVELADNLGNLLSRVTGKALNPAQVFPQFHAELFPWPQTYTTTSGRASSEDYALVSALCRLPESVDVHYNNFEAYKALDEIMSCLRQANAFVQRHEPWNLIKSKDDQPWLETVLHVAMETLKICGILLQPVVPDTADRLLSRLGVDASDRTVANLECFAGTCKSRPLGRDPGVLFSRLKPKEQS